jgi:hypothetical protein
MTNDNRALPKVLGGISADLRAAFGASLTSYANRMRFVPERLRRPKIVNDSIWKTVRLEWWEVLILDSLPVQRLRNIAQLGLAYLVYPGAGYSRFEHSIGVLYQTQRIIDSINHNARSSGRSIDPISRSDESLLRLSGLLHDIGHGFLSHVSERAMSRIENLPHGGTAADARSEAEEFFRCRKRPSFSEVLASLIVLLPEFVEVLRVAEVPTWEDPSNLSYHIAHLIVGSTPYSARPFLSEIISGSVDADKLDYMARDCFSAGLPMPVDVDRLLQKLQAVAISTDSDLGSYWAASRGLLPNESIYMMAIDERGGIAAEELVVSRVLLYDKLYHHQKIRALEGLVERALDLLVEGTVAFKSPATFLTLSDADFIQKKWPSTATQDNLEMIGRAEELIRRIHDRHETVRAIAFGPSLIEFPLADDATNAWQELKPYVAQERTPESLDFVRRIVEIAKNYLIIGGNAAAADTLREDFVMVDLPDPQGISEKTRFLVGNEQTGLRLYSVAARIDRWAEAYEEGKSIGYVYAPAEHAIAVHLAVRKLVQEIANITFQDRQLTLTKISSHDLMRFADLLRERAGDPPPVAPPQGLEYVVPSPERTETERVFGPVIAELVENFQSYLSVAGVAIDFAHVMNYLMQFSRDEVPLVLKTLRKIQFWTRQRLVDAYRSYFEMLSSKYSRVQLVALGGSTTSAEMLKYFIADIKAELPIELIVLKSIEEVSQDLPIVFYDDFVGSGGQGRTVFQQWYNVPELQWATSEHHVSAISPDTRDRLKKSELLVLFIAGRRAGLEAVCATARQLTGSDLSGWIVRPEDIGCFRQAANVFANTEEAQRAKGVFERVGRLALSGELWDDSKVSSRLLGYGNNADLNVFFYNVPTSTLTALWKKCDADGRRWLPLFLRRKRT